MWTDRPTQIILSYFIVRYFQVFEKKEISKMKEEYCSLLKFQIGCRDFKNIKIFLSAQLDWK